jgi:hypothetical protein
MRRKRREAGLGKYRHGTRPNAALESEAFSAMVDAQSAG